ncbi:MAG: transporter substrate-binding domain-containing protein [Dysgonamonadaceae bacterium]|jgi:membrane-bound lytic murein transglycosylase MltF|nr:transporter substrate-binding domain-containing protein [Dysgonamonadaceae bacterium]
MKKKINYKDKFYSIASIILTIVLLLYITSSYNKRIVVVRDFPEIMQKGKINIVTEYNSIDYYLAGDTIAGLQYDICKYIEKRSGLEADIFVENNMDICINGLENKTYDIIARNIPVTNEKKKLLLFTIPITQSKLVLIQRKPFPDDSFSLIRNQIDLAYKEVYVPKKSAAILRLRNLSEEIAEPIYIKEIEDYSAEQLIGMVANSQIDYAVVDKELASKNSELYPEIDSETDISFTHFQAWAVRKSSPVLLDSLNIWLSDFKKEHLQD